MVLTGKKKGNAKVQAVVGKKKLICKVTVKNASKENIPKPTTTPSPTMSTDPSVLPNPLEGANEQDVAVLKELIQA